MPSPHADDRARSPHAARRPGPAGRPRASTTRQDGARRRVDAAMERPAKSTGGPCPLQRRRFALAVEASCGSSGNNAPWQCLPTQRRGTGLPGVANTSGIPDMLPPRSRCPATAAMSTDGGSGYVAGAGGVLGVVLLLGMCGLPLGGCARPDAGMGGAAATASPPQAVGGPNAAAAPPAPHSPPTAAEAVPQPAIADAVSRWAGEPGAPFDIDDWSRSRAVDGDNGVSDVLRGLTQLSDAFGASSGSSTEPGKALQAVADLDALLGGRVPQAKIDAVAAAGIPALLDIDRAQTKPRCLFAPVQDFDTPLPHLNAVRTVGTLTRLALVQARRSGDHSLIEPAIRRSLRLARDVQTRGISVAQTISLGLVNDTLDGIERVLLDDPRLGAELHAAIIAALVEHEQSSIDPVAEGVKAEYIVMRTVLDDLQTGRRDLGKFLELLAVDDSPIPSPVPMPDYPAEVAALQRLTALALAESGSTCAAVSRASPFTDAVRRLETRVKGPPAGPSPPGAESRQGDEPAVFLAPKLSASGVLQRTHWWTKALLARVEMLCAIRAYERSHRCLPPSLEAAAAETALKTPRADPSDGMPMRYVVTDGRPVVYSIGADLRDDGGRVVATFWGETGDLAYSLTPLPGTKPAAAPAAGDAGSQRALAPTPPPPAARGAMRTWSSRAGTTVEAAFVELDQDTVVLEKADGSRLRVPLMKLIAADRRLARSMADGGD